jgi:signal transduction histidine kinase
MANPVARPGMSQGPAPAARRASIPGPADRLDRLEDYVRAGTDWTWQTDRDLALTYASQGLTAIVGLPVEALLGESLFDLGRFVEAVDGHRVPDFLIERRPFRDKRFRIRDRDGADHEALLSGVPFFDEVTERCLGYRGTGTRLVRRDVVDDAATVQTVPAPAPQPAPAPAPTEDDDIPIPAILGLRTAATASVLAPAPEPTAQPSAAEPSAPPAHTPDLNRTLATLVHELRTPLNAVIGYCEHSLQHEGAWDVEQYRRSIANILSGARHLSGVVDSVSEATGQARTQPRVDCSRVALGPVIEQARSIVLFEARRKGVNLEEVQTEPEVWVHGDPSALRQILVNLLGNAIKYTPKGGNVGLRIRPPRDGWVSLAVWDTGQGIPRTERERIFEPFYQVGASSSNATSLGHGGGQGLGLGLSIARSLARAMDGDITVACPSHTGSIFFVRLPAAKAD